MECNKLLLTFGFKIDLTCFSLCTHKKYIGYNFKTFGYNIKCRSKQSPFVTQVSQRWFYEMETCKAILLTKHFSKTRDYCVFGLCPSSGILKNTKEQNVSKAYLFLSSVGRWETLILLGPLERAAGPNRLGVSHPLT
jgi:hypothetical protein